MLTPILILYGQGYNFNLAKQRIEQTGIIYLKTYPRSTQIYLNNKLIANSTPYHIKRLPVGDYEITIKKDGYHSWQKKITVVAGMTTFIEDIVLYTDNAPREFSNFQLQSYFVSSANNLLMLTIKDNSYQLLYFDLNFNQLKKIKSWDLANKIELLAWSPNERKYIYRENNKFYWTSIDGLTTSKDISNNKSYLVNFTWHEFADNKIYSTINNQVKLLDLNLNRLESISSQASQVITDHNKSYILTAADNKFKSVLTELGIDVEHDRIILPFTSEVTVIKNGPVLSFIDQANNFLYLIDTPIKKTLANYKLIPYVKAAQWYAPQQDKILYWNDNEIQIYYWHKKQYQNVFRSSAVIKNANWHPNGSYIFFYENNTIRLTELDERDFKNTIDLVQDNNIDRFFVNNKGDVIYYYQPEKQKFYALQIQ
ncbi:MAG: hypothetical protein CO133_00765 [Candidatus Komeilibacteria bacterium CG_4_9_14_3_um_filter_37_5]|nr:MAG: hypothetical protein CO133_00765 [Candidatus Komeilibacteria bacterium CG_4_9_14_3_um_filter_37_5]